MSLVSMSDERGREMNQAMDEVVDRNMNRDRNRKINATERPRYKKTEVSQISGFLIDT